VQYVVELYLPRSRAGALPRATARARAAAGQLRAEGAAVHFLRSIFLPEDEICFLLFEGPSEAAVAESARRAEIAFERVVAAEVAADENQAEEDHTWLDRDGARVPERPVPRVDGEEP
jgi:hypothetical protein